MKNINWRAKIGELSTVVLGILIAFALNNFAQNRKDANLEKQYLQAVYADLEKDSLDLHNTIRSIENRMTIGQRVIGMFYNPNAPGRDSAFIFIFRDMTSFEPFIPNQSSFDALRYSGDLNHISNFELRNVLIDHYDRYEAIDFENTRSYTFIENHVSPYMMSTVPFEQLRNGYNDFLDDWKLRNIVFSWTGIYQGQIKAHKDALKRCRKVIVKLGEELAN